MARRPEAVPVTEWAYGDDVVSDDPDRIDLDVVAGFLGTSYWAAGRGREMQERMNAASHCFGVYHGASGEQIGFARVVTDGVTFAWIADVFVLDGHRGRGLGQFLMRCVTGAYEHVSRLVLATRDAHGLYAKVGFVPLGQPERWMERRPRA
jgi:GNAT superfamily N-acetyltransferase